MVQMSKAELEQRVVEASEHMPYSPAGSWLYSPEFQALLMAFYSLGKYYELHLDEDEIFSIHFYVIAIYARVTRLLNHMLQRPEFADYHEDVQEALGTIESHLDRMTTAGFSRMATLENKARSQRKD